jgi:SAM-dependent methyltransferase
MNVQEERLSPSVRRLWIRYYSENSSDQLENHILEAIRATDSVLEIGAGSGMGLQNRLDLRGKVAKYVGIDPDPKVLGNPYLDQAYEGKAEELPFADGSFDLVFHRFVAEHFEFPAACNREIYRVLKPGGTLLFLTPSRHYYPMLAARLTPHWFHELYVRRFASGRSKGEVFPTFYRLNDEKAITRELNGAGFDCKVEHFSTPPGYLRFSTISFLAGTLYERTAEKAFPALRARLLVTAEKRA